MEENEKQKKIREEEEYAENLRRIKRKQHHIQNKNKHLIPDFYWNFIVAFFGIGLVSISIL